MAWPGLTKNSRKHGIQTWRSAEGISDATVRTAELGYLSMRQAYAEMHNRMEQAQECAEQAARSGDKDLQAHAAGIIYAIQSQITDFRARVRVAGERSFAEAFMLCATHMLPNDVRKVIETEAEILIGRPRHELKRGAAKAGTEVA